MRESLENGPNEIEQALRLILAAARDYKGPHTREFAEIARRCAPSSPEELIGDFVEQDMHEHVHGRSEGEWKLYEAERSEPKERLAEVLSILLDVAFPVDKSMERAVREELDRVLEIKVRSLCFVNVDDVVQVKQHLPRRPKKADRMLRAAVKQFIPTTDSLYE